MTMFPRDHLAEIYIRGNLGIELARNTLNRSQPRPLPGQDNPSVQVTHRQAKADQDPPIWAPA
jgi:hypothetical protein